MKYSSIYKCFIRIIYFESKFSIIRRVCIQQTSVTLKLSMTFNSYHFRVWYTTPISLLFVSIENDSPIFALNEPYCLSVSFSYCQIHKISPNVSLFNEPRSKENCFAKARISSSSKNWGNAKQTRFDSALTTYSLSPCNYAL